tara:strand:+ start:72 stop:431 length:360 start_codon:yes stop_codon:yes gene_type:complete
LINKNRPYKRTDRVGDSIKSILGQIFLNKLFLNHNGLMTITNVKVSRDLRYAKVFVSYYSDDGVFFDILKELDKNKKYLRLHLGHQLPTKYVPELTFHLDDTLDYAFKINNLIKKTKKK